MIGSNYTSRTFVKKATSALREKHNWLLLLLLFVAFLLRFKYLRYQSFGLDELHTMNEADPGISWKEMFEYLRCCDQHPPLFFICERLLFTLLGSSEWVARSFTAACSVLGVLAVYQLGKEVLNKRLGLIAAAFTCVNYFSIFYAQEARGYSMAFLLSALSYRYFIGMLKNFRKKDLFYYTLFSLLLLYTHYFGILIVTSQYVVALILFFSEKNKKKFIIYFGISGIILAGGFSFWLPFVNQMSHIQSFWIKPISQEFIFEHFYQYFGLTELLKPILFLTLTFYVVKVFLYEKQRWGEIKNHPLLLSFMILAISLIITYMLPYIRSVMVVPMLTARYTIVVLPLYLLSVAYGAELISNSSIKYILVGAFVFLSLTDLLLVKKFYTSDRNPQFREVSALIANEVKKPYPVINSRTAWHQNYYLRRFGYQGSMLTGQNADLVDSILKKSSSKYDVDGFWLVDAFYLPGPRNLLDEKTQKALDSSYFLANEKVFHDAWAQLYISKSSVCKNLDTTYFPPGSITTLDNQTVIGLWGGTRTSKSFKLGKGQYIVDIVARGTPVDDVYPHLNISINDQQLGSYYTDAQYGFKSFPFILKEDSDSVQFNAELDNDAENKARHEDRNVIIKSVLIIKQ